MIERARRWPLTIGLVAVLALACPGIAAASQEEAAEVVTTRLQRVAPGNMCLAAFSRDPGSIVVQWSCGGPTDETQLWEFVGPYYVAQGGNYYLMRNKHTGLCLTAEDEVDGAPVLQQPCSTIEPPPNEQAWGITTGVRQLIGPRGGADPMHIRMPGSLSGQTAVLSPFEPPLDEISFLFLDDAPKFG